MYRIISKLIACVMLAAFVLAGATTAAAAEDEITIDVLLPVSTPWFEAIAQQYSRETGVTVNMEYCVTFEQMMGTGGMEPYYNQFVQLWADEYDIVFTSGHPGEAIIDAEKLVDLRPLFEGAFNPGDFFMNVIDSYGSLPDEGLFTLPLAFDVALIGASGSVAESLGVTLPESLGDRVEFTLIVSGISPKNGLAVLGDGYDTKKTASYLGRYWEAYAYLVEMCSLLDVGRSPEFIATYEQGEALGAAYSAYYAQSLADGQMAGGGVSDEFKAVRSGELLFGNIGARDAAKLASDAAEGADFTVYEYPYVLPESAGIYHSVSGVSIVEGENSGAAWDFVRYMLTAEAQSQIDYGCPVLRSAAENVTGGVVLAGSGETLGGLVERLDTPSYVSFRLDDDYQYSDSSSFANASRYAGSTSVGGAEGALVAFYRNLSPYLRNAVPLWYYVLPLVFVVAAIAIVATVVIKRDEFRKLERSVAREKEPLDRIEGRGATWKKYAICCFAAAAFLFVAVFLFDKTAAYFYPASCIAAVPLAAAAGMYCLFFGKYCEIRVYDGEYLVFNGLSGYYFTEKEIDKAQWSVNVGKVGCKIIISGPRVIYLKYKRFRDLDSLKKYVGDEQGWL